MAGLTEGIVSYNLLTIKKVRKSTIYVDSRAIL